MPIEMLQFGIRQMSKCIQPTLKQWSDCFTNIQIIRLNKQSWKFTNCRIAKSVDHNATLSRKHKAKRRRSSARSCELLHQRSRCGTRTTLLARHTDLVGKLPPHLQDVSLGSMECEISRSDASGMGKIFRQKTRASAT